MRSHYTESKATLAGSTSKINPRAAFMTGEKFILISMAVIQIAWLFGIGLLGASSNWGKLIIIIAYSLITTGMVLLLFRQLSPDWLAGFLPGIRSEKRLLAILLGLGLVTGVIYASVQRVWPFDEQQNFKLAGTFARSGFSEFLVQYTKSPYFANQHPFLVPLIYGAAMSVFGINLLVPRLVSLLFYLGTVGITYECGKQLFDWKAGLFSAAVLLTFPLMMRLGTVAMLDVPGAFFFILSIFLLLSLEKKPSIWKAMLLGLSMAVGFLCRYSEILVIPVLIVISIVFKQYRKLLPLVFFSITITGVVVLGWLLYAHSMDLTVPNFSKYIPIGLNLENARPKALRPGWIFRSGEFHVFNWIINSLTTRLPSAIGVYNIPLIFLGVVRLAKSRQRAGLMLLTWIMVVTLILLVTLPDHRYFMPTFPAMALLAGFWLRDQPGNSLPELMLALLLFFGSLYLFVDWQREAQLFTR